MEGFIHWLTDSVSAVQGTVKGTPILDGYITVTEGRLPPGNMGGSKLTFNGVEFYVFWGKGGRFGDYPANGRTLDEVRLEWQEDYEGMAEDC